MSREEKANNAAALRDAYAQKKYRDESKSQHKHDKDVAHYFSLELASFFNSFLKQPISKSELKKLVNERYNFRMVNEHSNRSTHRKIDNYLMKQWNTVIVPHLNSNTEYKKLLSENPTELLNRLKSDGILDNISVTLNLNTAQRAKAQTVRLQKLNFPHQYQAFARLFYKVFKDTNSRNIWDDRRNSKKFVEYKLFINYISNDSQTRNKQKIMDLIHKNKVDFNKVFHCKSESELKKLLDTTTVKARLLYTEINICKKNEIEKELQNEAKQKQKQKDEKQIKSDLEKQHSEIKKRKETERMDKQQRDLKSMNNNKKVNELNQGFQLSIQKQQQWIQTLEKQHEIMKQKELERLDVELQQQIKLNKRKAKNVQILLANDKPKYAVPSNNRRSNSSNSGSYTSNNYNHNYSNDYSGYGNFDSISGGTGTGNNGSSGRYLVGNDRVVGTYMGNGPRYGRSVLEGRDGALYTPNNGTSQRTYNVSEDNVNWHNDALEDN